ncbi:MAG: hypothetical protein PHC41_05380 [Lachnospiraceae bacterium]|nr:hypothetical protein [Lachnospiraceae bacterium]
MNKMNKIKRIAITLLTLCMLLGMTSINVFAATPYTYTVKLYAGNRGTFNGENKDMLSFTGNSGSVDFKDYVGQNYENITVNDPKYYVKGIRLSARDNSVYSEPSFEFDADKDYVVAYGIKANRVSYTVNYQDAAGNALAPSNTYYGDIGDKPVVAYFYIDNYVPQALALTKTLTANTADNVFTFTYTPGETGGVTTNTTTIVTPGTTTTVTDGTAAAGTTPAGTTPAADGTTPAADGTTPAADGTTPATPGDQAAADANAAADNAANGTTDTVQVPEDATPQGVVDLDEGDTPAGDIQVTTKSKAPMIAGIAIGVVALAGLAALAIILRKRAKARM